MTADTENLVLEHLRAIRATLGEHSNELAGIRLEISAMGRHNEIALELTQAEANSLKRIAAEWSVGEGIAAGRIIMEELRRRFGMPGGPKKAA